MHRCLAHSHPVVREHCCKLLDQLLVEDALDDLAGMLGDPSGTAASTYSSTTLA